MWQLSCVAMKVATWCTGRCKRVSFCWGRLKYEKRPCQLLFCAPAFLRPQGEKRILGASQEVVKISTLERNFLQPELLL